MATSTIPQKADNGVSAGSLVALIALGAASALWALFLWGQLLVRRAGGEVSCGFSDSASCGNLWDGS
ncbi:MAG: hypothetical protein ACO3JL_15310, partial [Myxococcota bacterium]